MLDWRIEGGILHGRLGWLVEMLDALGGVIDLAAIALLLVGVARFVAGFLRAEVTRDGEARVQDINRARVSLGRYILSALELFIVSDIMRAALSLAFADLMFLGLLVIIRSITSYFLERELDGLRRDLAP